MSPSCSTLFHCLLLGHCDLVFGFCCESYSSSHLLLYEGCPLLHLCEVTTKASQQQPLVVFAHNFGSQLLVHFRQDLDFLLQDHHLFRHLSCINWDGLVEWLLIILESCSSFCYLVLQKLWMQRLAQRRQLSCHLLVLTLKVTLHAHFSLDVKLKSLNLTREVYLAHHAATALLPESLKHSLQLLSGHNCSRLSVIQQIIELPTQPTH
mmetsp:Transcript_25728/g.60035  ORF Transcript_25728/g.60035 Transcript_25728/m.60035 type:complete len:208 (+) Transcript_25728:1135-1758(+)